MKLFRLVLLSIVLVFSVVNEGFAQQIPQFSQYIFNPVYINPAYAGYKQELYLQSFYRKQWTGVAGSPETFGVAGDVYLPESRLGIGGQVISDRVGAQRTSAVYGNLSYHLQLRDTRYLSFGTAVGLVNSTLDGELLHYGSDDDPTMAAGREQVFYPDLKAGLFLYDQQFFLGLSVDQMISSLLDLDKGDMMIQPVPHAYLSGGLFLDLSSSLSLLPSFMYMDDFKAPARLDLNTSLVINDAVWIGGGYRMGIDMPGREIQAGLSKSAAVIGTVQVLIRESLRLGYAYDHNVSGVSVKDFSSHDISISYLFPPKRVRLVSPRYF
ncbi:type IX secretion system membrane protein PorP/SprF [Algoriphagus sp. H41]|uniref:Type IX secretion system membrane protein PorP/SprF n=1 Tax=Algoriphagus oliviformis TaxID=2811231 RepID=A0ABS3C7E9_9BACT|nr:type IX secretion system membrane protein PorP/SprF [Algoriphagus oliviformis]MBN7813052.1 type IX secretion system membrane protein PorP/SprF [Algoriphagus oliviformis]